MRRWMVISNNRNILFHHVFVMSFSSFKWWRIDFTFNFHLLLLLLCLHLFLFLFLFLFLLLLLFHIFLLIIFDSFLKNVYVMKILELMRQGPVLPFLFTLETRTYCRSREHRWYFLQLPVYGEWTYDHYRMIIFIFQLQAILCYKYCTRSSTTLFSYWRRRNVKK